MSEDLTEAEQLEVDAYHAKAASDWFKRCDEKEARGEELDELDQLGKDLFRASPQQILAWGVEFGLELREQRLADAAQ